MENRKATEAGQDVTMQKEDFAVLWKTIHLKVTDTYEVPPEILWVNGSTIGTLPLNRLIPSQVENHKTPLWSCTMLMIEF